LAHEFNVEWKPLNKRILLSLLLVGFLAVSFMGKVDARGGVFIVEPMEEVTDKIELTVSDNMSAEVAGNILVIDGFIDFYVTSPSGIVLLCYNKTAFDTFKFAAKENGTYVMHLANTWSTNNVTATLNYGVNWKIVCQVAITFHATSLTTVTMTTVTIGPSPINVLEILQAIYYLIMIVSGILGLFGVRVYIRRKKKVEYIREFGTMNRSARVRID
jgi:hypothetical protein